MPRDTCMALPRDMLLHKDCVIGRNLGRNKEELAHAFVQIFFVVKSYLMICSVSAGTSRRAVAQGLIN